LPHSAALKAGGARPAAVVAAMDIATIGVALPDLYHRVVDGQAVQTKTRPLRFVISPWDGSPSIRRLRSLS